jgi:hypothetical protein
MSVFSQETLANFVRGLASAKPAPASGAAAAVALALAAGCAAKAFSVSLRHVPHPQLTFAAQRAAAIAEIALEGAQRDADDFRAWLHLHAPGAVRALEDDARILFHVACELGELLSAQQSNVMDSLIPDIASAKDFLAAFKAVELRNLTLLHTPASAASGA